MDPKTDADREEMAGVPYRNLLGSLLYLENKTRPDIACVVGFLCLYMDNTAIIIGLKRSMFFATFLVLTIVDFVSVIATMILPVIWSAASMLTLVATAAIAIQRLGNL